MVSGILNKIKTSPTLSPRAPLCKGIALAAALLLALSSPAMASRQQTAAAKADTVKAVEAASQGRWSVARSLAQGTRDTLASKIYFWMLFTKKDDVEQDFNVLTRFIRQNPDWPGIAGLKAKAERAMPESMPDTDVIGWYREYPPETAAGVTRYARALIGMGRQDEVRRFLSDWWATTTLSRDQQREIFREFNAYLDRAAHLRRFDAMLLRGEYVNARAVAQVLGQGYPELAEARIGLAEDSGNVDTLIRQVPRHLQRDAGFLYERLRWRRVNDMDAAAVDVLNNPPPASEISNPKDWWKERHIIIRRLLERRMYESAYVLAENHQQPPGPEYAEAEWLAGWLALRFMNNPSQAYRHFQAMYKVVETPVSKARGAYWSARAAKAAGDQSSALQWYRDAAQYQTVFYGQLAGQAIGLEHALPHAAPPALDDVTLANFKADELMQAAEIFRRAGQNRDYVRFMKAFIERHQSAKAYRYAAEAAVSSGNLYEAVRISKDATSKGLFLTAQSYPVLTDKMSGVDLEWALVHAIIRQESMFDYNAESSAGALGLMQLMPSTAREVAGKLGIAHDPSWLTTRPEYNIRLGSAYLARLVERFDGNYAMAAAGYNAGPGRVPGWIEAFGDPRAGQIDLVDWIELIPIYETRNYVQRVLENLYVYRLRLKGVNNAPSRSQDYQLASDERMTGADSFSRGSGMLTAPVPQAKPAAEPVAENPAPMKRFRAND